MSFTNPAALTLAILAVPIVIFYLLKTRMRRVPVATTMFWDQVFEENQPRAIWPRLQSLFSLLLQLLFLALLVAALMDPVWKNAIGQQRRIVLILDTSASMQAMDDGNESRFDIAKHRAHQLINSLKDREEMAIVVGDNRPQVACGLTNNTGTLREALNHIQVTDGPTSVTQAFDVGRQILADHPHRQTVVITDTRLESTASDETSWSIVGEGAGNVAITEFQARRSPKDPLHYEILFEVANFNDVPVSLSLDLYLNQTLLDVVPITLTAGEIRHQFLSKTSLSGGVLRASLEINLTDRTEKPIDALAADNAAFVVLPEQSKIPVTLVTDGNWFLQRVLEANDLIKLTVVSEVPLSIEKESVLVLHRKIPNTIPDGRVFVVDPIVPTNLWNSDGELLQPLIGQQNDENNLLNFVRLENVLIPRLHQLSPTASHETLIETISGSPVYLHFPRPEGDVLVLCVDLEQGDLPLRTAFPILFTNAIVEFSGMQRDLNSPCRTGESSEFRLPPDTRRTEATVVLNSPQGEPRPIGRAEQIATLPPLTNVGIWTLTTSGANETVGKIACNLANRNESDLRRDTHEASQEAGITASDLGGRPIWFALVTVGLILLCVEWLCFQRRWVS